MSLSAYETTRYTVSSNDGGNKYPTLMKETVEMILAHTECTLVSDYAEAEDSEACYRVLLHVGDDWYMRCTGGVPDGGSSHRLNVSVGTFSDGSYTSLMDGGNAANNDNQTAYCGMRVANGGDAWRLIVVTGNTLSNYNGHASMIKLSGSLGDNLIAAEAGTGASWGMDGYIFDGGGAIHGLVPLTYASTASSNASIATIFPDGTELLFPALLAIAGGINRLGLITINGLVPYNSSAVQRGAVGAMTEYSINGVRYINLKDFSILST